MINSVMTFPCDECKGAGFIFFGNGEDYDVEPCDCLDVKQFNQTN
jgi:hypothetical protein